jgi:hypothetical protein
MADQTITCPTCGGKIPLTSALTAQVEADVRARVDREWQEREAQWTRERDAALAAERERVTTEAAAKARQALSVEMADLQAQLQEGRQRLETYEKTELELRKRARVLEDREKQMELELVRRLDAERKAVIEAAEKRAGDGLREKLAAKDFQLEALRQQVEDMQRRIDQGSQQVQGEVSEIQLETALGEAFPGDVVRPVPKGVRGADVCQDVRDAHGRACGVIVWERKNTKAWGSGWPQKLKDDVRAVHGDMGVLVSRVLPAGVKRFGVVDGVWVAEPAVAVPLALALRAGLIEVAQSRRANVGKHEKMELLYAYLVTGDFRHRIEAVVEAVVRMRDDVERERRAMERCWKKRTADIDRVIQNFACIYGDLQSVAGKALPDVPALALPGDVAEDDVVEPVE